MADFILKDLNEVARSLGRAVMFGASDGGATPAYAYWDETADLQLDHLADTEGDIAVNPNDAYSHLMVPELTGPAKHVSYVDGEDPTIEVPVWLADPLLRAIVAPTANASGGYQRRRPVRYHTLVFFPEQMFYDTPDDAFRTIRYTTADGWEISDGAPTPAFAAFSTEQTRLLGLSLWAWRAYFSKPPLTFRHGDGGKSIDTITIQICQDSNKPDGHQLYTVGDPADAGIVLDVA